MDWDTLNPVIRLKSLLGPVPTQPWCALIPQLLMWSFSRFCIEKLLDDKTEKLMDYLWEDHVELIQKYAPNGLKNVAAKWLTPDNISKMHSSPQIYNAFFIDFITLIDTLFNGGDGVLEDNISEFLDVHTRRIFAEWLSGPKRCLLIYPQKEEDDDVFTDTQFMHLIQSLLTLGRKPTEPAVPTVPTVPTVPLVPVVPTVPVMHVVPTVPVVPAMHVVPTVPVIPSVPVMPVLPTEPTPDFSAIHEPSSEPPFSNPLIPEDTHTVPPSLPAPSKIAEALRRRMTYRFKGKRANRGITLRTSRARTKTRKVHLVP